MKELSQSDFEEMTARRDSWVSAFRAMNLSYDDLLDRLALSLAVHEQMENLRLEMVKEQESCGELMRQVGDQVNSATREINEDLVEMEMLRKIYGMKAVIRGIEFQKRRQATSSAKAMLAKSPKQQEKAFVRECWDEWQKNPDRYKGKTAFAKDMLLSCERLENQNVIVRWCGAWEKENSTQLAE